MSKKKSVSKAMSSGRARFDERGLEIPDSTPMEIPVGYRRPETLQDQIRRMVRVDLSAAAEQAGAESFDEANDFDIEDDDAEYFPTHHELHEEVVDELRRVHKEAAEGAQRRRSHGAEEEEVEDEVQESSDEPSDGDDIPRSRKSQPRSAQRRAPARREHAESDDDEIDRVSRRR